MRVMVDGMNLALEKGTGVATYARNLTYCLKNMEHTVDVLYGVKPAPNKAPLVREVAFFDHDASTTAKGRIARKLSGIINPLPRRAYQVNPSGAVIYQQFASRMPRFDYLWNAPHIFDVAHAHFKMYRRRLVLSHPDHIDIAHWSYPLPVRHATAKNIYTLHDLVPLRLPYATLDEKKHYYNTVSMLVRRADHIVTVSETSKRDIINLFGVDEQKVTNTYQSAHIPREYLDLSVDRLRSELKGAFALEFKRYMIFFGSLEPKKNIVRLIEAHMATNIDIPLVVVGGRSWQSEREGNLLRAYGGTSWAAEGHAKNRLIHLDYVSFPQLVKLIRGARGILFPSLYEGFGLPILEGMICGTPVITSNIGSMREISDDTCLLVDPYSTHEIKDAITEIATNDELCAALAQRGRFVAKRFSEEAHQRRLEQVYNQVMKIKVKLPQRELFPLRRFDDLYEPIKRLRSGT